MSLSYWNKFDKRTARQNAREAIEKGQDYALCPKRKKQDKYIPAEPFNLLLKSLIKASSNESRRTDSPE